ncbi:hypothetical protein [Glycomyces tritici]|uniref:Isopropylmalate isomerase n=1 Tax=Glycomyces tritici TaxID=2665176 RepID=A0ABT7YQE6_9ACTN|nr:hypothetical protein [Glycomyces tritici]MDN3240498.1 hypothetical protein [Glycomyces tritici]
MSTPPAPKSAFRKAAKGAVMAGTAALAAVAVGTLVKRRLDGTEPPGRAVPEPLPRKESE